MMITGTATEVQRNSGHPLSPNVFGLRITLLDHRPEIWRRVLVPGSLRLDQLHMGLQEAMGWTNDLDHGEGRGSVGLWRAQLTAKRRAG